MRSFLTYILLFFVTANNHAEEFTLGADISWTTEMESKGRHVYNYKGEEREATALMKEMGLNAVRLRVWVDPHEHGGWCSKEDVLNKALRAKQLGMDIMVDFHYSDWWADPAKQNIPTAWAKHKYKQMLTDVATHTKEVLQLLKDNGVTAKWVQVGNETSNGFLWPIGQLDINPKQYAGLFKAGYDAVKEVMPESKVIVHLDNGYDNDLYNRNLDALRENGAQWDIIGMSLYPYWAKEKGYVNSAAILIQECLRNVKMVSAKYGTDVMIVETGYEINEKEPWLMESGRTQLAMLIDLMRTKSDGHCLGVFYWEPTCKPSMYKLGAFTEDGHPTAIMRAFTQSASSSLPLISSIYDRPLVCISTGMGDIIVELYNDTPLHRDNFLKLANNGTLNGTTFHRVLPNFMIQGGDTGGEAGLIDAEIMPQKHFHKRGALCAARADDNVNPERKSNGTQFYITWGKWPTARRAGSTDEPLPYYLEKQQAGVPYLDGEYTVFGEVFHGMNVVEKIQSVNTDATGKPTIDVLISNVKVLSADK